MKRCGKDVQMYLLDGADHGGAEFWSPQVMDIVQGFIERCFGEK